jgi:hypothetical protein
MDVTTQLLGYVAGSSTVQVESKSLERLLEALDSRHVSGWYHPAMRLQAQLQSVEGSNAVLREQLRSTRYVGHSCTLIICLYQYLQAVVPKAYFALTTFSFEQHLIVDVTKYFGSINWKRYYA